MIKVIGVRFRTAGKIYFFDPMQFEIKKGDRVIVETARGIEFGMVVLGATEVEDEKVIQPLKPVIRIANEHDREQEAANKIKEKDAFNVNLSLVMQCSAPVMFSLFPTCLKIWLQSSVYFDTSFPFSSFFTSSGSVFSLSFFTASTRNTDSPLFTWQGAFGVISQPFASVIMSIVLIS